MPHAAFAGHEMPPLAGEELEELCILNKLFENGGVRVFPENIVMYEAYPRWGEKMYNMKYRPGDVMVAGCMKTGTTWTQEIVWTMLNNPDLALEDPPEIYIKSPYIGMDLFPPSNKMAEKYFIKKLQNTYPDLENIARPTVVDIVNVLPDKRVIKTHLPPTLLNPNLLDNGKVVYTMRDPKDVLVSLYNHHRTMQMHNYKGTMEEFVNLFIKGRVIMGEMANLVKQWLALRDHKNFYILYYEEMNLNTMEELKKLSDFLGCNLTQEQLEKIKHYTSFAEMRKVPSALNPTTEAAIKLLLVQEEVDKGNGFFRKGKVGDSETELNPEQHKKLDKYFKQTFTGVDLPYSYLKN